MLDREKKTKSTYQRDVSRLIYDVLKSHMTYYMLSDSMNITAVITKVITNKILFTFWRQFLVEEWTLRVLCFASNRLPLPCNYKISDKT